MQTIYFHPIDRILVPAAQLSTARDLSELHDAAGDTGEKRITSSLISQAWLRANLRGKLQLMRDGCEIEREKRERWTSEERRGGMISCTLGPGPANLFLSLHFGLHFLNAWLQRRKSVENVGILVMSRGQNDGSMQSRFEI